MFADARPDLTHCPAGFAAAVGWSDEAADRLADLGRRLAIANETTNLVGRSTLAAFWSRHVLDSAQLIWFAPDALVWADIGSGAGFPGLVLGVLLKGRPGARVHLIESKEKKCRFLRESAAALDLPCEVHQCRAEDVSLKVDVLTARACAPLCRLLSYTEACFARGARGLFLKGEGVDAEIREARRMWRFEATVRESLSDARGRILAVEGVKRGRP